MQYCDGKPYVKPYQANIMLKRYPLVRGLYYILKENYNGLGGGFANFMIYEKGQLIFQPSLSGPCKNEFYNIDQQQQIKINNNKSTYKSTKMRKIKIISLVISSSFYG